VASANGTNEYVGVETVCATSSCSTARPYQLNNMVPTVIEIGAAAKAAVVT
jgi:hypothetical protein